MFFSIIIPSASVSAGSFRTGHEETAEIHFRQTSIASLNGGEYDDKRHKAHEDRADDAAGDAGGDFDRSGICEHPDADGPLNHVQHDPSGDRGDGHGPAGRDDHRRGLRPDQLPAMLRHFRDERAGRGAGELQPGADVRPAVCFPGAGGRAGGGGVQGDVQDEGAAVPLLS